MFFKRRRKQKSCFHKWKLIDYNGFVDRYLDYEERYILGCAECGDRKHVDKFNYDTMVENNLIVRE